MTIDDEVLNVIMLCRNAASAAADLSDMMSVQDVERFPNTIDCLIKVLNATTELLYAHMSDIGSDTGTEKN